MFIEPNQYPGVDPYAVKAVRCAARNLARQKEFHTSDIEDLEQEFIVHLFSRMDRYDPQRGQFNTFIDRVLRSKTAVLVKRSAAKKRQDDTFTTHFPELEDWEKEDDNGEETPVPPQLRCGIEGVPASQDEDPDEHLNTLDRRLDMEAFLGALPEELRDICLRLDTETPAQIAEDAGLSRRAVYWCLQCIRQAFAASGMTAHYAFFGKPNVQIAGIGSK